VQDSSAGMSAPDASGSKTDLAIDNSLPSHVVVHCQSDRRTQDFPRIAPASRKRLGTGTGDLEDNWIARCRFQDIISKSIRKVRTESKERWPRGFNILT
jgi:hypothetical protein